MDSKTQKRRTIAYLIVMIIIFSNLLTGSVPVYAYDKAGYLLTAEGVFVAQMPVRVAHTVCSRARSGRPRAPTRRPQPRPLRPLAFDITELEPAVRYVHFGAQLVSDNTYLTFEIIEIEIEDYEYVDELTQESTQGLPQGIILRPTGELYGIPYAAGVYTFTVRMNSSSPLYVPYLEHTFTLYILENTNENVDAATTPGYEILARLGTPVDGNDVVEVTLSPDGEVLYVSDDYFISGGAPEDFIELAINGVRLQRGVHFYAEPGSTVITIRSQTFAGLDTTGGINTISAEFRAYGDAGDDERLGAPLNRAAQNFTIRISPELQQSV